MTPITFPKSSALTFGENLPQRSLNVEISCTSPPMIIYHDLRLSTMCARWVPHWISDQCKEERVDAALRFQQLFEN